jgi:hypothetical protein
MAALAAVVLNSIGDQEPGGGGGGGTAIRV